MAPTEEELVKLQQVVQRIREAERLAAKEEEEQE